MALLLKGGRVVDPAVGLDAVADVVVRDGVIVEVGQGITIPKGETIDCSGTVVMPGLVDVHTHLREPGREDEETIATGTAAAAHGGFTAVCAMPNTTPVCDTGAAVRFVVERAQEQGLVRVHPVGALTRGQEGRQLAEIGDMLAEGAVAFSDDGRGIQSAGMARTAMEYLAGFDALYVGHCEDESLAGGGAVNEGVVSTRMGLPGQPAAAEEVMVAREVRLAELTGCRVHIAHVSTAGSLELVRQAKRRGARVTCEVTPHHLFLDEDAIVSYDTDFKMNPPLRTRADREALVAGLLDGTVDAIATDHAPHAAHEKELEFELAPFGIIGLETAVPLVVTHLVEPGVLGWSDVVRLMSHGPRAAFGLPEVRIAPGMPADITVVDPDAPVDVDVAWLKSKSRNTPFKGQTLRGRPTEVLVGGRWALRGGEVVPL
ncbi:MAG: dihydroorotase [Anaerosomatales bacterium]|uniref:dihydroorotase n=1 Tax=Parvivirga hydrogeniphila TaxID=2939460 RepID=UPI002260AD75|nr:dihydroorotase [Parvivirga hydrogeniphila]MCL4079685.1 dihydroorotase [Parvivirga hydrogeniphila]MDI6693135.1 dihydroorotase [Anaerosomatales bacterium]